MKNKTVHVLYESDDDIDYDFCEWMQVKLANRNKMMIRQNHVVAYEQLDCKLVTIHLVNGKSFNTTNTFRDIGNFIFGEVESVGGG